MTARVRPRYYAPPQIRYHPRRRGFRGLGDDGTDASGAFLNLPSADNPFSNPFTPVAGDVLNLPTSSALNLSTLASDAPVISPSQITPTAATSPTQNWAGVLQSAVNAAGAIGKQLTNPLFNLPPGTYAQVGPGGTIVTTAAATIPTTNPLASLTSSSLTPLLLLGGAGLLLFMVMGKK
jgi:hypothetical protein